MNKKIKNKKINKRKIPVKLLLILLCLSGTLFVLISSIRGYRQEQHLQCIAEKYSLAYNTIYEQHRQLAKMLYLEILDRYQIPAFYQQVSTADELQVARLRQELLSRLQPWYEKLRQQADIEQIQFFMANNVSLLRMNQPGMFGDDLTDLRKIVASVNSEHAPLDGFETGRFANAYRFVFPVTDSGGAHLGSMEISFGPAALISSLMKQYEVLGNFLIREEVVHKNGLSDPMANRYRASFFPGYLFDNTVSALVKNVSHKKIRPVKPPQDTLDAIYANVGRDRVGSVYDRSLDTVFTTIPVLNPVTHEKTAFFIVRSRPEIFKNESLYFTVAFSLCLILLIMFISTFSLQASKKKLVESNTRELEKQRRLLLDAQKIAKLGHWEIDLSTFEASWSSLIYEVFGISSEKFTASTRTFLTRVHPDDRTYVKKRYAESVKNHQSYDFQHRVLTGDGVEKWVRQRGTTDYDKNGKPIRSYGTVQDITRKKLAEEKLRILSRAVEQSHSAIIITDPEGRIEFVNPAFVRICGYTEKEVLGRNPSFLKSGLQDEYFYREMWKTLTAGKVWRNEIYNKTKDGSCYWESATISPVKDEDGQITHYVAVKEDISLRKKAEIERQEHYDRLVTFMETLPDAVVLKDGHGCWLLTNQVAKIRFKLEDYPWQGKTDSQLAMERAEFRSVHEACANSDEAAWKTVGGVVNYEEIVGPDGQLQILEVRKMAIFDENCQRKAMVIVGRDITEHRIAEQEQEKLTQQLHQAKKMESIGLMAGGVAHDLNNILSGIVGYPELILQGLPPDSKLIKPINAILRSGKNAAVVVADLLTVARGAASIREVHDLNELVREYLDSLECKQLRSLHQKVIFGEQCEAGSATILCSAVHVKKCLMNLVINGAEAILGKGQVVVATRNEHLDERRADSLKIRAGEYIILQVRDSGSGIEGKDLEHIFEPFYSKKVMGRSGTGLGLAVVWNTMEDHNGKVVAESSARGTCFTLYFPRTENTGTVSPDKNAEENLSGNNEHILIVDDEEDLQNLGRDMLQLLGYKVDCVASGEEAVEFIQQHPVDLVVLDMMMEPGMNGRQTYQEILQFSPHQRALVVSGFSESEDVKATLQLGAGGFIKKPYLLNQFGRAVREALVGQCYPGSTLQRNYAMKAAVDRFERDQG